MVLLYLVQTRFYIERRKDGSGNLILHDRPILMSVSFLGDRVMLSTGIKADFHGWDPEQQRLKSTYPGSYANNAWLDALSDTAQRTWTIISESPERPDADLFRSTFLELKPRYSTGFFNVFYQFMENGTRRWSTSTYRKVRTVYKHLREFEESKAYRLSFRSLDDNFLRKFRAFYAEKGNSVSTTGKAINILVWFLNWASGQGYNVDLSYRKFYRLLGESEEAGSQDGRLNLFLQWEELVRLSEFRGESRKMEWVRDLFCFMCFTGLNYNELQSLHKEDIRPDEVRIRKINGRIRRVPMNERAREIHRTYESRYYLNNTAFPTMSIITLNKYLRMLGKEAGLDRMVESMHDSGEKVPLAERLTAGMAVHTFIANALELEVSPEVIASFTGVRKDSRVRRIKMEMAREAARAMDR